MFLSLPTLPGIAARNLSQTPKARNVSSSHSEIPGDPCGSRGLLVRFFSMGDAQRLSSAGHSAPGAALSSASSRGICVAFPLFCALLVRKRVGLLVVVSDRFRCAHEGSHVWGKGRGCCADVEQAYADCSDHSLRLSASQFALVASWVLISWFRSVWFAIY